MYLEDLVADLFNQLNTADTKRRQPLDEFRSKYFPELHEEESQTF